jgi:putative membrane protein insertion efficiency factor
LFAAAVFSLGYSSEERVRRLVFAFLSELDESDGTVLVIVGILPFFNFCFENRLRLEPESCFFNSRAKTRSINRKMPSFSDFFIGLVRLYQAFAPAAIRDVCLFTPCCSEYMILSIRKHGLIFGSWRGLCRICRCHSPNGGIDFP